VTYSTISKAPSAGRAWGVRRGIGSTPDLRRSARGVGPLPTAPILTCRPLAMCDASRMRPTLFEFAGGQPAFLALAAAHHARCLEDPELNHPFSHPGQNPRHVERLAAYWAEVLGGPPDYSRTCADESHVLRMHAGNGDMTDLGRRFVDCFDRALDDAGLPTDPAFRAAMLAYMRWAVDVVLSYGDRDAVVPLGAELPRWGWDGLQP